MAAIQMDIAQIYLIVYKLALIITDGT